MTRRTRDGLAATARKSELYWVERAVLDFTADLLRLMEIRKTRKSDLARALGASKAYVTKVFRGDANFTILSMVRLVRALDGKLRIRVDAGDAADAVRDDSTPTVPLSSVIPVRQARPERRNSKRVGAGRPKRNPPSERRVQRMHRPKPPNWTK